MTPPGLELIYTEGFYVRKGLLEQDKIIIRDVYKEDCYGLKALISNPKYEPFPTFPHILDVGAHIGCFTRLCQDLIPQCRTISIEANKFNINALGCNTYSNSGVRIIADCVCGYFDGQIRLASTVFDGSCNSGGSTVVYKGQPLKQLSNSEEYRNQDVLTWVNVEVLTGAWSHIDLMKLDCEGSEYNILENCDLSRIHRIVCEFHGDKCFEPGFMDRFKGWDISIRRGTETHLATLINPCVFK